MIGCDTIRVSHPFFAEVVQMKKVFSVGILFLFLFCLLTGCGCRHEWNDATCNAFKIEVSSLSLFVRRFKSSRLLNGAGGFSSAKAGGRVRRQIRFPSCAIALPVVYSA